MNDRQGDVQAGAGTFPELSAGMTVFGRYVLLEPLAGTAGRWRAEDSVLRRTAILRFLPGEVLRHVGALALLKDEVRRAMTLMHPRIVRVHDFVEDGRAAAIVTDDLQGQPLAAVEAREVGPLLERVVVPLCEALEYGHLSCGLRHRQLCPECLRFGPDGAVQIDGYGIAAAEAGAAVWAGLPAAPRLAYSSPQVLRGMRPTVADDIYSLGAVAFRLATGAAPYSEAMLAERFPDELPSPLLGWRQLARGLLEEALGRWGLLIGSCLAAERDGRPRSVAAVRQLVTGAERHEILATQAPEPEATVPWGFELAALVVWRIRQAFGWWLGLGWRWSFLAVSLALLSVWLWGTIVRPASVRIAEARRAEREKVVPASLAQKVQRWAQELVASAPPVAPLAGGPSRPEADRAWQIPDLGMRFVPLPGGRILCSVLETRVRDFAAFVAATGHDATSGIALVFAGPEWVQSHSWANPGFAQGPRYPVVNVSEGDAEAFCAWLTARERAAGRLAPDACYRLPTDAEWELAAGEGRFPWGEAWPPPSGLENLSGALLPAGQNSFTPFCDYDDGFATTWPAGTGAPNALGIFDLGGNVQERVGGRPGGLRGGSCYSRKPEEVGSRSRGNVNAKRETIGFRVVCALRASGGVGAFGEEK